MQLSTQYSLAFLCNPKSASTSIEKVIKPFCSINCSKHPGLKHVNYRKYAKYILPLHQDVVGSKQIETFSIVREPMDWLYSWYTFRKRDALKVKTHPHHLNYTGNISFEQFVMDVVEVGGRKSHAQIGNQFDFVTDESGKVGVDKIFRMDDFTIIESYLSEKFRREIKIPLENASTKRKDEISQLSQELVVAYEMTYKKDFELYSNLPIS